MKLVAIFMAFLCFSVCLTWIKIAANLFLNYLTILNWQPLLAPTRQTEYLYGCQNNLIRCCRELKLEKEADRDRDWRWCLRWRWCQCRFALCHLPWQQLSFMGAKKRILAGQSSRERGDKWLSTAHEVGVSSEASAKIGFKKMRLLANSFCLYA